MSEEKLTQEELLELLAMAVQNTIEYFVLTPTELEKRIPDLQQAHVQLKEIVEEWFQGKGKPVGYHDVDEFYPPDEPEPTAAQKLLAVNTVIKIINGMEKEDKAELRDKMFPSVT